MLSMTCCSGQPDHHGGHQGEHPARPEDIPRGAVVQFSNKTALRTIDRLAKAAGIQEVSPERSSPGDRSHPYPQSQPCGLGLDERRAPANGPEAGRAQEAVPHGDLCHRGAALV